MAHRRSSGWSGAWQHVLRKHGSAVIAGTAGTACFSLILATIATLSGDQSLARLSRTTIAGQGWGEPSDDSAYQEVQDRRNAEDNIENLRESYKNRERELKQNFKGLKLDFGTVKSLMATWKQAIDSLAGTLASGSTEDFWTANNDFHEEYQRPVDDAFQGLYAQQSYAGISRQFKENDESLKAMEREVKDLKKKLKQQTLPELSTIEGYVNDYRNGLSTLRTEYASISPSDPELQDRTQDLQDKFNDLSSIRQDFYDITQGLNDVANAAQTKKDAQRRGKEWQRSIKDQQRQLKNFKKLDTKELPSLLDQEKALFKQLEQLLGSGTFDPQDFWDLDQEWNDISSAFWEQSNELSEQADTLRQEKDTKRTLKDKQRQQKDIDRDCKRTKCQGTELEGTVGEYKAAVSCMKDAAAQKDYDRFWECNGDADQDSSEFWNALNDRGGGGGPGMSEHELKKILKEIAQAERAISESLADGKASKELATTCRDILQQGRDLIVKIQNAGGDERDDLGQELSAIGDKVDATCGEFFDD